MNINRCMILVCGLLGSMPLVSLSAEADNALRDRSQAHYQAGEHKQALDGYQLLNEKDYQVYFNMGNAAYKLGDKGNALLYWRKAERLSSFSDKKQLLHNIALLKIDLATAANKLDTLKKLNSFRWWMGEWFHSFLLSMPLLAVQLMFLFLWLFLFVYVRYLYRRRHKVLIVTLFSCIALLGGLLALRYSLDHRVYGVVIDNSVKVYSGPAHSYEQVGLLSQAQELIIVKEQAGFYRIKSGLTSGWVSKNKIGSVNE